MSYCRGVSWIITAGALLLAGCQGKVDPEEQLIAQLKHNDVKERSAAAVLIRSMRPVPEHFIPPLLEALNDNDPQVRQAAADALGEVGNAGRPYLTDIGKLSNSHFDPQVRYSLERAFHNINTTQ